MALEGKQQTDIALALNLSRTYISRELADIRREWQETAVEDRATQIAKEIARLNALEAQFLAGWERSRAERQESFAERTDGSTDGNGHPTGEKRRSSLKKIGRDGDARFLEGARQCVMDRVKVLGLAEPVRLRHGGDPDSPPIQVQEQRNPYQDFTTAELDFVQVFQARARQLPDGTGLFEILPELRAIDFRGMGLDADFGEKVITVDQMQSHWAQARAAAEAEKAKSLPAPAPNQGQP